MRSVITVFFVSLMCVGMLLLVGASHGPFTGPAGPCPNCAGTPPPTSAPSNNQPCIYTPPSTIPFYQALEQAGLTQKGNGTCIPFHEFTEIEYDSSFCTTACVGAPGLTNMNLYADFSEDGTAFSSGPSNNQCETNYPYNINNAGWGTAVAPPPSSGACKPMKYVNENILHSNEQIAVVGGSPLGPNIQACTKPGTGIKFYGTPTNPQGANPAGLLGDAASPDLDIEHDGVGTTRAHDIYFTDQTGCKNTSGGPTPSQNYLGYLGSTHLQNWMASLESGATVGGVCAYGPTSASCATFSAAGGFADNEFMYEHDQSTTSIQNATTNTGANSQPTNPPSTQTTTQHWANDQAMVNDRVADFNAYTHQFGTTCETQPTCIATGTGYAAQFNGLTNAIVSSNSCYLYTGALTGNYASTNVLQGELEMPTAAFNGRNVEPRDWAHVINCISDIFANTNDQVFFNDHETLDTTYKFYYDVFALKMLAWSNGRISSELRLDDGGACGTQCNPNLTVYPLQMLVPDPTAAGSPALGKFAPPASTNGRDANRYDGTLCPGVTCGGNLTTDGTWGGGCDAHDNSTDHGAVDLLAATLTKASNSGSQACTGAGFSTYAVAGCGNPGYPQDYKCNPEGVYVREFANMYYNGSPITSAPISSAANYMAVVLNPTELTYQVQCGDLPLEGGANYGHIITATPSTPTQNSMDMVNGGSLVATTAFACGTASANLAPESAFILVK